MSFKPRELAVFVLYIALVIIGTALIQGRSLYEWVQLLVPPGTVHDWLIYPLQHHNPVTFAKLYRLADTLVNILLFLPLGMLVFLFFQRIFPHSIRKILIIALLVGLCLSSSIEMFQYFVPKRIPSLSDVIANSAGMVFGCYIFYVRKIYQESKIPEKQPI